MECCGPLQSGSSSNPKSGGIVQYFGTLQSHANPPGKLPPTPTPAATVIGANPKLYIPVPGLHDDDDDPLDAGIDGASGRGAVPVGMPFKVHRDDQSTGAVVFPVRSKSTKSTAPGRSAAGGSAYILRSFGSPASTEGTVLTSRLENSDASVAVSRSMSLYVWLQYLS